MKIEASTVHVWRWATAAHRDDAERAVRKILSMYVGTSPDQIELRRPAGTRRLVLASGQGLQFNLTHSGREALLAVAQVRRVGVDIERTRPVLRLDCLIRRFFSDREAGELLRLEREERDAAFFRTWVRKEAYLKAVGGGVPAGLRRFSVSTASDGPPAIRSTGLEDGGVSSFSLHDLDVPEGHAGALAVEGTGHRIRYMSL